METRKEETGTEGDGAEMGGTWPQVQGGGSQQQLREGRKDLALRLRREPGSCDTLLALLMNIEVVAVKGLDSGIR